MENMPESQCGFRSNRRTIDMIIVLRQIQEKCREQNIGLYAAFVDLTKAFDTVSRDGLWKMLAQLGFPQNFSPSFASPMKVSKVRSSTMGICRAAYPSPAASIRDASWPLHCSPSSSASWSVRQKRPARRHLHPFANGRQCV